MRTIRSDIAVLGAGSGGCAAAYHLSASGASVTLVEAGPDYGPFADGRWPSEILDARLVPLSHDWGLQHAGVEGRHSGVARAKIVGGCSSHNECAATWPLPSDFDRWAALLDDPSWSYAALRPLIDEIERCVGSQWRGGHGLLPTRQYDIETMAAWQRVFVEAATAAGHPRLADLSGPDPIGTAALHANVRDGVRWNASFAFVDPLRGTPGFVLRDRTSVERLVFAGDRAVAAESRTGDGTPVRIEAERMVLAGGTFGSPTILLRSGVGDPKELARLDIETVIDLPDVGLHLQDHVGVVLPFALNTRGRAELERELSNGRFAQSQSGMRAPTSTGDVLHLLPYQMIDETGTWVTSLLAYAMNPASSGRLRLRSGDPGAAPHIELGYHSDSSGQDAAALREGVALLRDIAAQTPIRELSDGEQAVTAALDDEALHEYIRTNPISYAHQISTCRMGASTQPAAVCDANGRVRGTSNVYVADAAAFPDMPSANTNLACMLLGWRVASKMA